MVRTLSLFMFILVRLGASPNPYWPIDELNLESVSVSSFRVTVCNEGPGLESEPALNSDPAPGGYTPEGFTVGEVCGLGSG